MVDKPVLETGALRAGSSPVIRTKIKKSTSSRISKMPIFLFSIIRQQHLTKWQECDMMHLVSKSKIACKKLTMAVL